MCAPGHMSHMAHMYVSVMVHCLGGLSDCPLAYATYRTWRHLLELWTHLGSELLEVMSWATHPIGLLRIPTTRMRAGL